MVKHIVVWKLKDQANGNNRDENAESSLWKLELTSTRVSTHTYVNPLIAVFIGWLFANEQINTALLIATIIIIIALYLVLHDQYMDKKNEQR